MTEKSFSSGIFFLNFQDLYRQISDLAYRDSPRFSQALDLLNASFLKEELTPVTHSHYSYRQILFGSEKLLLFLLLISPFLFRHTQTASFLQRYWPLFCAGFSLTAGVAALCWYSNYRFRQAVQLSLTVPFCLSRQIHSLSVHPRSLLGTTAGIFEKQQRTNFRLSARLHSILGSEHIGSYCFFRIGTSGPAPGYFAGHPVCQTRSALFLQKIHWDEISVIFGSFLRTVLPPGKNRPFTALTPPIMRF